MRRPRNPPKQLETQQRQRKGNKQQTGTVIIMGRDIPSHTMGYKKFCVCVCVRVCVYLVLVFVIVLI